MSPTLLIVADGVRGPANASSANAILVEDGRVGAVGRSADLRSRADVVREFAGATVLPGLRDAHLHPVPYAALLSGVSLKTAGNIAEIAARLQEAASRRPGPIVALRMDDETLAERRIPIRADLDAAVADRPVLIHRYCGHVAVANTAALRVAGIDAMTLNPVGGVIDRDPDGLPTGVLRETAIEIVSGALSGTVPVAPFALVDALRALASLGLTSIGGMVRIGDGPWSSLGNEAELLGGVAGDLPIRVHGYVIANTADELKAGRSLLTGKSDRLRWAGLKRFADGSLGGHTAAMLEPFSDAPGEMGTLRLNDLDAELSRACFEMGGAVAIHAIGDLACRRVIDLFEDLGAPAGRCRIEHASVIDSIDIARMARLGIAGCVQPAFLGSEAHWLEHRVGGRRLRSTYPFASLEAAGVTLAAGSDSPVEPPDPWSGIALAHDRAAVVPDEALAADRALALYTSGAANVLGEPTPLAVGSPADLIVVDRDPTTSSPDEVRATQVHYVLVGGEAVEIDPSLPNWAD